MKIEFVNHASFVLETGTLRLICDPWIEGTAFDNGWKLVSPTRFSYSEFASITHIWISHEHPDHFHVPSLRKISPDLRSRIKVLFQETSDKRVVNSCREMGFSVQELPLLKKVQIAPEVTVLCGRMGLIDSWLALYGEGIVLLNLNDCSAEEDSEIKAIRQATGRVDVLLLQCGYAGWVGDPTDPRVHAHHVERKKREIRRALELFEPAQVVPFANFTWYCHAENQEMNRGLVKVGDTYRFVIHEVGVPAVVLYPGDEWEVGSPKDSQLAIQKYESDLENSLHLEPIRTASVDMETLQREGGKFLLRCLKPNSVLALKLLRPAVANLHDLGKIVEISFRTGVTTVSGRRADITLSSEALHYCLTTDWGGETLLNNGRFEIPPGGKALRFFQLFRVPTHNSYGNRVDFKFLIAKLYNKAYRSIRRRVERMR